MPREVKFPVHINPSIFGFPQLKSDESIDDNVLAGFCHHLIEEVLDGYIRIFHKRLFQKRSL
jgi:hypothetical protein